MSLLGALDIASSGLANINRQLAVVSQNVANASTPGYARETGTQQNLVAGGLGMGVRSELTGRDLDEQLQQQLFTQTATVSGLQTRQASLQAIDAVQGTPGQGGDIASLLGKLQDAFTTLASSPDNQTQQSAVVNQAQGLAQGINALSSAYGTQRQNAEDAIVTDVSALNSSLSTIGTLTNQIMAAKAAGQSTADLENQRDAAIQNLAQITDIKTLKQSNGDLVAVTGNGLVLPVHGPANPFSTTDATTGPGAYYPGGGIPPVMLGGVDVTSQITGGRLGANLALRDSILPGLQAQLDEFANGLASRFDAQGLRLFTDPTGAVPASTGAPVQSGYVGFASEIQVNPAVLQEPALVRDGTQAVPGNPAGASAFTPNPPGG
ncbi:MAG: flagellar hook-associated protein FlgK, partial [Acetobacteraceae bacterium]|nr:flagellar hook-associated protein FlgK [Acetobacteraceae bacterium]